MKNERIPLIPALLFIALLFNIGYIVTAILYDNAHISTSGAIASLGSINVSLYWDVDMTDPVQHAYWGTLEPGESNTLPIYVVSDSVGLNMTIRLFTGPYIPSEIEQYLIVSWDREGAVLTPQEITEAKITLSVTPDAPLDSAFVFDVLIEGSG